MKKQLDVGFLEVSKYPQWVANIVPVPKKDDKVWMCVDYQDLNRASPKDNFPLPHIDALVDNTAKHSLFSFMDGFSSYNQIKMAPEDMKDHIPDNVKNFLLQGHAFRAKERRRNIPKSNGDVVPRYDAQRD